MSYKNHQSLKRFFFLIPVLLLVSWSGSALAQKDTLKGNPDSIKPPRVPSKPRPSSVTMLELTNLDHAAEIKIDDKALTRLDHKWESESLLRIKLPPGKHDVAVTRNGFEPFNTRVNVPASKIVSLPIALERSRADLLVKAQPGTRVYLNEADSGLVSQNGQLVIKSLISTESYRVKLEHDDYETIEKSVEIAADRENVITAEMTLKPNSTEFVDNFAAGLNYWDAPMQWQTTDKRLLHVQGGGVGMPKKRRYCEGQVIFGLKFKGRGAAWMVRAKDNQNYYLFCLNWPENSSEGRFQTFICRNGKYNPDEPAIISTPIILPFSATESYRVVINFYDDLIIHELIPSTSGDPISIGLFKDPNHTFACGNIGFTSPNGEDFFVDSFVIFPVADRQKK